MAAEIVAGVIDKPDETPEDVVRREAVEEANCAIQISHICDYSSARGDIRVHCLVLRQSRCGGGRRGGSEEEAEDIMSSSYLPEALAQLRRHIRSAAPIIALQWLQLNHDHPMRWER